MLVGASGALFWFLYRLHVLGGGGRHMFGPLICIVSPLVHFISYVYAISLSFHYPRSFEIGACRKTPSHRIWQRMNKPK